MGRKYDAFVAFIILNKLLFMICAILGFYFKPDTTIGKSLAFWKDHLEFIFIAGMAILTLIIFRPFQNGNINITPHEQFLFFIYGIIILINANWSLFIEESIWFQKLKGIL